MFLLEVGTYTFIFISFHVVVALPIIFNVFLVFLFIQCSLLILCGSLIFSYHPSIVCPSVLIPSLEMFALFTATATAPTINTTTFQNEKLEDEKRCRRRTNPRKKNEDEKYIDLLRF